MLAWSSLPRNTASQVEPGKHSNCSGEPYHSPAEEKRSRSLRQSLPSTTSLPQLWAKKTLNDCFFLALLDVSLFFVLSQGWITQTVNSESKEGRWLLYWEFPLFPEEGRHIFSWVWLRHNVSCKSWGFFGPAPPSVILLAVSAPEEKNCCYIYSGVVISPEIDDYRA